MKSPDGATVSSWTAGLKPPQFPPPKESMTADVCVVGAGIAGITTAYLLAKEGKNVIVLDEGEVGSGQTSRTSAHLASATDDRFVEIEKIHGQEGSRIAYQSNAAAIDLIETIARHEKIECEFKRLDAYLFSVPTDPKDLLHQETAAAQRAGLIGAQKFERITLCGYETGPCIRFPNQARFHPLKYLYGLADVISKMGVQIYCGCRVKDVQGSDPKKHEKAKATIDDGPMAVMADAIVVATNTPTPINDWFGIYTKQASYRTYVIAASVPKGKVDDALYWDTADPYHYVRLEPAAREGEDDLLLIGGEDHKTGQMEKDSEPFQKLENWGRKKFPMIGQVKYRWSGQVQEPADGVAFIGRALTAKENVFVITGDSGMGLTHGTLGAKLVTDQIMGRPNPWEKLYDPSRKQANTEFIKENINVAKEYLDLIGGGEVKDEHQIQPGTGAVMRSGMKKIAVYRDDNGAVHRRSAICTHLKCVVQWNAIEKSWDCPCHGSRFDPIGRVLMGPAIDDLPKVES